MPRVLINEDVYAHKFPGNPFNLDEGEGPFDVSDDAFSALIGNHACSLADETKAEDTDDNESGIPQPVEEPAEEAAPEPEPAPAPEPEPDPEPEPEPDEGDDEEGDDDEGEGE